MKTKQNARVLIAEDDFLVSEMVQGILEDIGYQLIGKATNGRQAIEMTQTLQPDLVLMDIQMPDMNGIEATRHIQATCPTPVVVLTAYETPALVHEASAVGIGAYLVKPPDAATLERAMIIAMARFEDMMTLRQLNAQLAARNEELQAALARVKLLSGLLPICASCKKIRDDEGYWHQVEVYIREHSEADFSHGVCPECMERLYPEIYQEIVTQEKELTDILAELGMTTAEAVAAKLGVSTDTTLYRLQDMVTTGRVKHHQVGDESYFELKERL